MSVYCDSIEFVTVSCGHDDCSLMFGMPRPFYDARRRDHKTWYCPNGHARVFTGKSETEKLRDELERKEQMLDAAQQRAIKVERQRNEVTRAHQRMRARIQNGVCPCCNRTFQNLLMHMQTEHPEQKTLRSLREAYGLTQSTLAQEIGISPVYVSGFENDKHIPAYAENRINEWVQSQAPKKTGSPA